MSNQFTVRRFFTLTALFGVVFLNQLFAQKKSLNPVYDPAPIVVPAGSLEAMTNDSIEVFTAYCYTNGGFRPSLFQIDEVDAKGRFLRENDAIADSNDQVVFMPIGTGDRAPTDQWIDGSDNVRLELEVTDPLTNEKGWLYLFRHVKTPPKVDPYVRYVRGPETVGSDTVFATSYIEAHDPQGWFTDTRIRTPFGDGVDILDRQKVRVGGVFGIFRVTLKDEENVLYRYVRHGGGPVRVLREYGIKVTFLGAVIDSTGSFFTQYFPYSTVFGAQEAKIPVISGLTVNLIRQSVDLNDRAVGMKFFNAFNRNGLIVDGVADSPIDKTITDPPDGLNWFMITGNPGTILTIMNIPVIGSKRELYYLDDATIDNGDTGDKKSYGDSGILVTSTGNITGTFSFDFTTYYLAKNQAVTTGDQFKQRAVNPWQVTAVKQTRTISAVSENLAQPTGFELADATPNPFAPQLGYVRIGFNLGQTNVQPNLRIFNLLGQEVARFEAADLLRNHAVLWNGRDRFGRVVPAGIYFYELEAGRQRAVKKLVVLR
ncbi:MAG: T9SS type A sorting domain-containing protein [candidate division KSB1 bacterium]|nr:T9SS type A sorting domain-containing protein [candidate division KSB1 bacterium]MDZ7300630.1 T9SS type A sorting domain-containing protein [candidate division KSB1 bacterium]MDZ7309767.1 T9SS type A sorting domain-containing protein [candidate division KSB1 bacterium]